MLRTSFTLNIFSWGIHSSHSSFPLSTSLSSTTSRVAIYSSCVDICIIYTLCTWCLSWPGKRRKRFEPSLPAVAQLQEIEHVYRIATLAYNDLVLSLVPHYFSLLSGATQNLKLEARSDSPLPPGSTRPHTPFFHYYPRDILARILAPC